MPELQHFGPQSNSEDVAAAIARDGGAILDDVITPDEAEAIRSELRPYVETTGPGEEEFGGKFTSRTGALIARSERAREALLNPRVTAIADQILLPHCQNYQLVLTQLIRIMPGETSQTLHRDRWIWGTPSQMPTVEPQLGAMWALTDFTVENGATQVVPGSSTWPIEREAQPHEIARATMRRGSVLVYTGTVLHGGGANVSPDQDRWGMLLNYGLGWIRQEENQYLSCPPEIARTLKPEVQAMIGYRTAATGLGYYTPPLPPGEGPGISMPEYAVGSENLSINSPQDFLGTEAA